MSKINYREDQLPIINYEGGKMAVPAVPGAGKTFIVTNLVAKLLQEKKRLTENVIVVCETDKEVELPDQIGKLELTRQKTYGISKISIYEF